MEGTKNFIIDAKRNIKNETIRINKLHTQIGEYETLMYVVEQTGDYEKSNYYREKLHQCYSKIDAALENIKNSRDLIATMKVVDKIIKRKNEF